MQADSIVVSKGGNYTMSTNDTFIKQQWQDQEALHRFQLISPLLQTGLDDARRIQLRKTIADENNISVRTLYRYEKACGQKRSEEPLQKNSSQVSDRLTVKSIVLRAFRKTLGFSSNRLSSSAGKFRNGQLPRSFTFWKQKVLWLPAF